MFADISGFTALTERLGVLGREGAEELTVGVNGFFHQLLTIIHGFRGDVLKFGGDALLIGFQDNIPPQEIIRCAFQLQRATGQAGCLRTAAGKFHLGLHMGIAFGRHYEVVVGTAGNRREHFLYGDNVHRCQQAADLARAGEVVAAMPAGLVRQISPARPHQKARGFYVLGRPEDSARPAPVETEPTKRAQSWWDDLLDPQIRSLVSAQRPNWIGEHRAVSVGFVFFKGSASWQTDAAGAAFHRIYDAIMESLDRWGGVWGRSDPGSAYQKMLFLFGAPTAGENDPLRAVGFGLDIHKRLTAIARAGVKLDFGIGLATGRVFGGFVGARTRCEYTVMGDAINLAARLAARSFGNRLTIDDATARAAAGRYHIRKLKPARLKGKTGHIPLFRPVGLREATTSAAQGTSIEYYPAQSRAITQLFRDRGPSRGLGVALVGEAGCGKSTLAQKVIHTLVPAGGPVIQATVWPEEKTIPFSGISRMLDGVLRLHAADRSNLREMLQKYWPKDVDPRWQALFAEVSGFSPRSTALVRGLNQQAKLEKLGELLPQVLASAVKADCPTLLIDNYQWLDPSSRAVVNVWWKAIERYPFNVLITGRDSDGLLNFPNLRVIVLGAVEEPEIINLVRGRFPDVELPKRLIAELIARSKSVPAVADAYLEYWIDGGRLYRDPQNPRRLQVADLKATELPDALLAAYVRQLDRLAPAQREVIHSLAVWGGEITLPQLGRMLRPRPSPAVLTTVVTGLVRARYVTSAGGRNTPAFSLAHPLLGQAACQIMSFATRRLAHARAATIWSERRGRGTAANLARHYLAAGNESAALPALRAAGHESSRMGANQEARHFLEEASRLADKQPDQQLRMEVCTERAGVEQELGNYDIARRLFPGPRGRPSASIGGKTSLCCSCP